MSHSYLQMGKRKTVHKVKNFKREKNVLLVLGSHGRQLQQLFNKESLFNLKSVISPGVTFEYVFFPLKSSFQRINRHCNNHSWNK